MFAAVQYSALETRPAREEFDDEPPASRVLKRARPIGRSLFVVRTGVVRPWWHALWALPRDRSLVWQALGAVAAPVVTAAGLVVVVENLLVALRPDYAASTGSIVVPLIYATVLVAVVVGFRLFFAREYSRYCGEA